MKLIKYFAVVMVVLLLGTTLNATTTKMHWATCRTGGGDCLDGIDGAGLTAGDSAIVSMDAGTTTPMIYFYRGYASSAAASDPTVISPAANAGTFRWHLSNVYAQSINLIDNTAYNATSWDNVTTVAASKNAVRDKFEALGTSSCASGALCVGSSTAGNIEGSTVPGTGVMAALAGALDTDLSSVSASDDTIPSAKAAKAMGDLKIPKAQKFTQCITIKDPVATSDYHAWRAPTAITITNMHCLASGGTSLTGQFQECDANGANCADVDSTADMTCTAGSNVNDDGTISNPSIDADDYILWKTTSVSGTQTQLIACFDYTIN